VIYRAVRASTVGLFGGTSWSDETDSWKEACLLWDWHPDSSAVEPLRNDTWKFGLVDCNFNMFQGLLMQRCAHESGAKNEG